MHLSNTSILSSVELALYALLVPLALYIAYRHGRHGLLGYFYLNISIAVRIAAAICQLIDNNNTATPSIATAILSSIGLSPLLLAVSGILHELHHYLLLQASSTNADNEKKSRWPLFIQIQIHTICTVGMTLLIIGSVHLAEAQSSSDANAAYKLRSAGAVLWFVTWLGLMQYIAWLFFRHRRENRERRSSEVLHRCKIGPWLLCCSAERKWCTLRCIRWTIQTLLSIPSMARSPSRLFWWSVCSCSLPWRWSSAGG